MIYFIRLLLATQDSHYVFLNDEFILFLQFLNDDFILFDVGTDDFG